MSNIDIDASYTDMNGRTIFVDVHGLAFLDKYQSFSTAQFSANSLDESDLEELLDEEVAPARCKGPDPKSLERGGKHTGLVIKAHAFTICFELF